MTRCFFVAILFAILVSVDYGRSFDSGLFKCRGTFVINIAIRLFVGAVFAVLAAAFIGLSAVLAYEYEDTGWFAIAAFDSQLFLFFPLFGVLALFAFYLPARVLFDIYWRHVIGGKWIITIALLVLVASAPFVAQLMLGQTNALWDLTPETLKSDPGESCEISTPGRDEAGLLIPGAPGSCARVPFLQALKNMRTVSREQNSMSVFVRNCRPNKLIATPASENEQYYCFVNNQMQTAKNCCAAQQVFKKALETAYDEQDGFSNTRKWYRDLLPFHVFFLLLIFGLGISLARRGKWLDRPEYTDVRGAVETRVLAGAILMLFWPLLNHSFLQSADLLYGNVTSSTFRTIAPMFTVLFGLWSLTLLFFFFRSFPATVKKVGQVAGIVGSAVAFLKFDEIVDALSRMLGAGADQISVGGVLLVAAVIVVIASANRHLLAVDRTTGDNDA